MNNLRPGHKRLLNALLFLSSGLFLAACSSGTVKGESPFAQVNSWRIDDSTLSMELRLRNVNDEPLELSSVKLDVFVERDVTLVKMRKAVGISIPAGGFETIQLQATATENGVILLGELSRKERASLAYRLEGVAESRKEGALSFRHDGHIYTVPGRTGEFR